MLTIAHRRAVDRVRSETAAAERERSVPLGPGPVDGVAESVESSLGAEQVRRCLAGLTELQRESITLAYYSGYTYPQVAKALKVGLATVKSRIRGGLIGTAGLPGRGGLVRLFPRRPASRQRLHDRPTRMRLTPWTIQSGSDLNVICAAARPARTKLPAHRGSDGAGHGRGGGAAAGAADRVLAATAVTRQLPPDVAEPVAGPRCHDHPGFRGWRRGAVVGVAAAVTLGVVQVSTQDRLNTVQAENQAIAAVLAAPDAS